MGARDLLLGLDLGTSSLKGIFISATGEILAKYEIALTLHRDGDVVEQDARDYIAALVEFVLLDRQNTSLLNRVKAIGLSGHTPSLLAIDKTGAPTAPVIIWQDNRATTHARALAEKFGDPREIVGTSLPWSPSGTAAKAFWLSEHRPDVRKSTRWLLQPKDFLGFLLTGSAISDPWSTKGLCNVRTQDVIESVLSTIGWDASVVPQLRDGFVTRGDTTQECATRFGIPEGIPVSVGWSDAMCGMLALGAFSKPTSFIITGTSAIVGTSSAIEPRHDHPLYLIPAGSAPYPVTFGPTQMSGGSISWAAKLFGITENELVALGDSDVSANVPVYLPYIAGERAPLWRSDIRGRFTEVSVEHGRSAFARATMEGICFAERQVLELSQQLAGVENVANSEVVLSGRAGNDPHWLATRLRTMGRSLRVVDDMEITCRGAAILADVMLTHNFQSSTQALSLPGRLHHPSAADVDYGQENFDKFLKEQRVLLGESKNS